MTDARVEDRDRLMGQPVEARQDGWCPGCDSRILGRREDRPGEMIVQLEGAWIHEEGCCSDLFEAKLQAADRRVRVWQLREQWASPDDAETTTVVDGPAISLDDPVKVAAIPDLCDRVRELGPGRGVSESFNAGYDRCAQDVLDLLSNDAPGAWLRDRVVATMEALREDAA